MQPSSIRVLLVDDHAVVREGYRALLHKHDGITVVGEAATPTRSSARMWSSWTSRCRGAAGIDAIQHLRRWDPGARVLVFTMHAQAAYADERESLFYANCVWL